MILYVNGDSHTAGAESATPHAFAEDDGELYHLGRQPHPANLEASWGNQLSKKLKCEFVCDAESAASNYRIERTTRAWLDRLLPWQSAFVAIGWSTWEREEWPYNDQYLQVGSSGLDHVPHELKQRYKEFVVGVNWTERQQFWHDRIWKLHCDLDTMKIPHVFFNCNNKFDRISQNQSWGANYIDPYGPITYDLALRESGFVTVNPQSWHFGQDAHCFWAEFLLQYIKDNQLLRPDEIPTY
jgi:hypothetical protein